MGILATPGLARAALHVAPARPLMLQLHFQRVGTAAWIQTNGQYVLYPAAPQNGLTGSGSSTLLDERTMAARTLPTTGAALDRHWVWWGGLCEPTSQVENTCDPATLYDLATGRRHSVPINYSVCLILDATCVAGSFGTRWFEIVQSCFSGEKCDQTTAVQNLRTGVVRSAIPVVPQTKVFDADQISLMRPLCSPLRNSPTNQLALDETGDFDITGAPLGNFAIAYSNHGTYLERCATRLHFRLPWAPVTANSTMLLQRSRQFLPGILLASRRRFIVPISRALVTPTPQNEAGDVVPLLSTHRLWLITARDELWTALLPKRPRLV